METFHGSCHCGAIRFSFKAPRIDKGLRCNCSICRRKGAVMSAFVVAPEDMAIEDSEGQLATYAFASGVAQHQFCRRCGIYPFHQTLRKPGETLVVFVGAGNEPFTAATLRDAVAMTEHVMAQFDTPAPDVPDTTALTERRVG